MMLIGGEVMNIMDGDDVDFTKEGIICVAWS